MSWVRSRSVLLVVLFVAAWAPAVHAEIVICNHATKKLLAAIAYPTESTYVSEGWTTIRPGRCAVASRLDFTDKPLYVFAESYDGRQLWGERRTRNGGINGTLFCLRWESPFRLENAAFSCPRDGKNGWQLFYYVAPQASRDREVNLNL